MKSLIIPECILFKAPYEFCMFITRSRMQYTWTRDLCNDHCCAFRCLCRTSLMRAPVNLCVYFLMTLATMSYQFYSIAKPNPIVDDQLNHCHQVARQYDIFGSQSISKCRWNFYSSTDWLKTCQTLLWWSTTPNLVQIVQEIRKMAKTMFCTWRSGTVILGYRRPIVCLQPDRPAPCLWSIISQAMKSIK